jgi:hypothetical protein
MRRKNYVDVLLISFSLFFLETLFFKTALYLSDYLQALLIIAYAMLGLGLGALISLHTTQFTETTRIKIYSVLIISIVLSFLNFVLFPGRLFFSPVLIIPFAAGNVLIAYFLRSSDSYTIYFYDLLGAAFGVLGSVIFIPLLREENCFMLIICLLQAGLVFKQYKTAWRRAIAIVMLLICAGALSANLAYDKINFAYITRCTDDTDRLKLFCWDSPFELLYSKGSNAQRIEIVSLKDSPLEDMFNYTVFNGRANDAILRLPYTHYEFYHYQWDPRIVKGLVDKPRFLLIGASAEGVIKSAKAYDGHITAVEINRQLVDLMQNEMLEFSGNAYDHINELHVMDGRTFLETSNDTYDIITLMNIHLVQNTGYTNGPEYLNTREAIAQYLNHLSSNGLVIFEERISNRNDEQSVLRIMNTILHVLKERGVEQPGRHIYAYMWIIHNQPQYFESNRYCMFVVKKKPFSDADFKIIKEWADEVENQGFQSSIIDIYPALDDPDALGRELNALVKTFPEQPDLGPRVDLSIVTDDKPFAWAVHKQQPVLKSAFYNIGKICMFLLIIILLYFIIYMHKEHAGKKIFNLKSGFLLLYFSSIGAGYFILEVALINLYQKYTGSPAYTFIFILGSLLVASGVGSYLAGRISHHLFRIAAVSGIIIFSMFHVFLNTTLIHLFGAGPLFNSLIIALTIVPLGVCMGLPFPFGLEFIKRTITEKAVPLFFAVNCIFSTFAVIWSFYLSVTLGIKITFFIGLCCYLPAVAMLALPGRKRINECSDHGKA